MAIGYYYRLQHKTCRGQVVHSQLSDIHCDLIELWSGSSDAPATIVDDGCQFRSCPSGSPGVNHSSTDDSIWYVNSYPAAAMAFGIETIAPQYFNMSMDLAITGPNVGCKSYAPMTCHKGSC